MEPNFENRSHLITIRVSASLKKVILKKALENNLTVSEWGCLILESFYDGIENDYKESCLKLKKDNDKLKSEVKFLKALNELQKTTNYIKRELPLYNK